MRGFRQNPWRAHPVKVPFKDVLRLMWNGMLTGMTLHRLHGRRGVSSVRSDDVRGEPPGKSGRTNVCRAPWREIRGCMLAATAASQP